MALLYRDHARIRSPVYPSLQSLDRAPGANRGTCVLSAEFPGYEWRAERAPSAGLALNKRAAERRTFRYLSPTYRSHRREAELAKFVLERLALHTFRGGKSVLQIAHVWRDFNTASFMVEVGRRVWLPTGVLRRGHADEDRCICRVHQQQVPAGHAAMNVHRAAGLSSRLAFELHLSERGRIIGMASRRTSTNTRPLSYTLRNLRFRPKSAVRRICSYPTSFEPELVSSTML